MSAFDTYAVVGEVGALNNGVAPLFPAPSDALGGGITVVKAYVVQGGSGSASMSLVKGTLAGGTFTANGTLSAAVIGTATTWTAGVVQEFSLVAASCFIDAGEWVGLKENNNAAGATNTRCTVLYQMGR